MSAVVDRMPRTGNEIRVIPSLLARGELDSSLLNYGLPDFSSASIVNLLDQNRIRRALETAVANFEPRLRDVKVKLLPTPETERALHFRIDARLRVEPAPEPVTFDTVLHIH